MMSFWVLGFLVGGNSHPDLQPVYMQLIDCFLGAFFS